MSHYADARFLTSAYKADQFVADEGLEVAFAGRSNAGKSSAINAIVGRRDFARTSKTPGRTQLVNFFALDDERRIVDLPGYGYARVSRAMRAYWQELMEDYFRERESLRGLILTVDARRGLGDFDWQMLDWCRSLACPVHVLLTKADKLGREEANRVLAEVKRDLNDRKNNDRKDLRPMASAQLFSATTKIGVEQARQRLEALLAGQGIEGLDGTA